MSIISVEQESYRNCKNILTCPLQWVLFFAVGISCCTTLSDRCYPCDTDCEANTSSCGPHSVMRDDLDGTVRDLNLSKGSLKLESNRCNLVALFHVCYRRKRFTVLQWCSLVMKSLSHEHEKHFIIPLKLA